MFFFREFITFNVNLLVTNFALNAIFLYIFITNPTRVFYCHKGWGGQALSGMACDRTRTPWHTP